jgi:hypothetical protein
MRNIVKRTAVCTLLTGAALSTVGLGVANADNNTQVGLVNVIVNNVTIKANVNVDAAAAVVANLCGLDLPAVNALVYNVSQTGAPVTACNQSTGSVVVTKSA